MVTPYAKGILMCDLLTNIGKIHTTSMGEDRIRRNLLLGEIVVEDYCVQKLLQDNAVITKQGKNWYVSVDDCIITINAHSYTIITAHKIKN